MTLCYVVFLPNTPECFFNLVYKKNHILMRQKFPEFRLYE